MCDPITFGSRLFALVGGNFNNGTKAGLFIWNCNNASSNSNWNYGARLLIFLLYYTSFSIALARNYVETGLT